MIKTLLFGAGEGCRSFIKNEKNKRDFLAIIDNDLSREGEIFEHSLIISPFKINNYIYDEIVITTQWAKQVKMQLINDLHIDSKFITIPPKNMLKKPQPFLDTNTHKLATLILQTLTKSAQKYNIELLVDFGTLLGIVRDQQIMPWDDDIDFAVHKNKSSTILSWLLGTLEISNFPVKLVLEKQSDKNANIVALLLKFTSPKYNSFTTSISFRDDVNGFSVHLPSLGLWYAPSKHFLEFEEIEWKGIMLKIPKDYESYLEFLYGDWKVPKKFINMTDYNNLGEIEFDIFEEAGFKNETLH
jgi:lipopolysaccharide cholinephosphotransferase